QNIPPDEDVNTEWPAVDLREVHPQAVSQPFIQSQLNRIGFGTQAFETFQVNVPDEARCKSAKLRFKLQGDTEVYLDNVFFKSEHLKFGNPDLNQQEARPDPINQPNNYLIERPQYALSYSDSLKTANWVSYKSDPSFLAGTFPPSRPPFREDFSLPFADKVISNDYSNVGRNNNTVVIRGHLVPNQDRALTTQSYHTKPNDETGVLEHYEIFKDNAQTYLMTNVVPQVPEDRVWQTLEGDLNEFVSDPSNARNEVYIIAGTLGSTDQIPSRTTIPGITNNRNQFNINVPEYLWKVVLIPEEPGQGPTDITYGASAFGVLIANDRQPQGENWKNSSVSIISSVNDIEDLTGLDFFSNIPEDIQEVIENYIDTSIIP
ncbi:MAG: DNA/RNA non-specific endonuclease, partial [Okeania sp. SIO3C4]|nr:DNA/RNA non-specific endonuclease [Okeania sp. SIO3C4]